MPFELKLLHKLTNKQIDQAIQQMVIQHPSIHTVISKKISPVHPKKSFFTPLSPCHRLFDLINPEGKDEQQMNFSLSCLGLLLGGEHDEVDCLANDSPVVIATRIFLKFKIYGDQYVSEFGNHNTCLHDAILSCGEHINSLIKLLILNEANPDIENDGRISAPILHVYSMLNSEVDYSVELNAAPHEKLAQLIAQILFDNLNSALDCLKVVLLYDQFNIYPGFLTNCYYWSVSNNSFLHLAARKNSAEIVLFMLNNGANPDALNTCYIKPIHTAVRRLMKVKQTQPDECIGIIVHLLIHSLKRSLPSKMVLEASHIVDELVILGINREDYREKICRLIFKMGYIQPLTFTDDELIATLNARLDVLKCHNITIGSKIAAGTFGCVYKGNMKQVNGDLIPVAIKMDEKNDDQQIMRQEESILRSLSHPNIIRYICSIERDNFGLVMEYAKDGTLHSFIRTAHWQIANANFHSFSLQMNSGLQYLHEQGYVHLDFKPNNILLHGHRLLIADFGTTALQGKTRPYPVTTTHYCAPEGFDLNEPYHFSRDIFSFGVCLGEMSTRSLSWLEIKAETDEELSAEIQKRVQKGTRTNFNNKSLKPEAKVLVEWCWDQNPLHRPNHSEIHTYIDSIFKM